MPRLVVVKIQTHSISLRINIMATLFQRLIGGSALTGAGAAPEEQKIAIHTFTGVINEIRRGKVTPADAAAMFNLDTNQQADALVFRDLLIAAPDKIEFMRVFKDFLYCGEDELDARYSTAGALLQRLQDEVIDQGGTLP